MTAPVDDMAADGLPRSRTPALVGALTLLLIAGPFIALAFTTRWSDFHFASGDADSIAVSLAYSLISLMLIVVLGTPLAWWLARHSFRGKWILEAIILLALLTPPLAMGILLTTLYGPYGPVGRLVTDAGVELTNSAPAFVLAQFYGALPYYLVAARAAFEGVPRELEHIALTLGKSPWQTFWLVSMPLRIETDQGCEPLRLILPGSSSRLTTRCNTSMWIFSPSTSQYLVCVKKRDWPRNDFKSMSMIAGPNCPFNGPPITSPRKTSEAVS
jgi:molybdate/tungstate transport system permease protein